jgi:hypothetical protein
VVRILLHECGEHRADAAKIDVGSAEPDNHHGEDHHDVFKARNPCRASDAAGIYKEAGEEEGNHDAGVGGYGPVARFVNDQPQSSQLQLQIGDDERHPDQSHRNAQRAASKPVDEEIRLSVKIVSFPQSPDGGEQEKR